MKHSCVTSQYPHREWIINMALRAVPLMQLCIYLHLSLETTNQLANQYKPIKSSDSCTNLFPCTLPFPLSHPILRLFSLLSFLSRIPLLANLIILFNSVNLTGFGDANSHCATTVSTTQTPSPPTALSWFSISSIQISRTGEVSPEPSCWTMVRVVSLPSLFTLPTVSSELDPRAAFSFSVMVGAGRERERERERLISRS